MLVSSYARPVPTRALGLSLGALAVPVISAFLVPDWTSTNVGMLIWLTALIPAFLLAYYRGLAGVAIALAGGMAVIVATQVSIVAFDIADPNWTLLIGIVVVYLAIATGIAGLAEVLRRERRAAEEMALLDRLTELPNRRHAEITLEREFAAAERGRELSVVVFDLDHFKRVNDTQGHAAGDIALKAFAKVLRTNTRKENLSARFGGEEFVSVLRDTPAKYAVFFAQRVLKQMSEFPLSWGKQTVSAGVAEYQKGMGSHEILLSAADRALYQAKEGGRNMVCTAPPAPEQPAAAPEPAKPAAPATPVPAGQGKRPAPLIYVVDDDEAVRGVVKRILVGSGYMVWDTGDPLEAIRHFTTTPAAERPDLVVTDVIMPPMSGMRMIDQIAAVAPGVKVIYMSGYVQSKISVTGTPGTVIAFLEKPLNMDLLLKSVGGAVKRDGSA